MSNPEKDDEGLARKWLESQGYTDITRPCSDPPDYVVNSAYAVEVRRLNQRIERRLSLWFLSWGRGRMGRLI